MSKLIFTLMISLSLLYLYDPSFVPADVPVSGVVFGGAIFLLIWILRRI